VGVAVEWLVGVQKAAAGCRSHSNSIHIGNLSDPCCMLGPNT